VIQRTMLGLLTIVLCNAPAFAGTEFNVRQFGAIGDGKTKDTSAFQHALDACAVSGGAEVLVPAGDYLIGSIQIGTKTIIHLDKEATLRGTGDLDDYPIVEVRWEGRWELGRRSLIYASNVDHIGIIGPGHIIGNPALARTGTGGMRGALVLEPVSCSDVRWEDFSTEYTGTWSNHPTYCSQVSIRNLTIRNGRDGLDIDSCNDVRIDSCDIESGDDSISLKSGRGMDGARLAKPCENVLITRCALGDRTFACVGIGSETSGGIRNVRIEHCRFTHSGSYAVYIKTRIGRAGTIENIAVDDVDVEQARSGFLRINMISSGNKSTPDDMVNGDVGIPVGKNFHFSNIRLHDCPVLADITEISPVKPIDGLSIQDVSGSCLKGISLANINNAVIQDIHVEGLTGPLLATLNANGTGLEGAARYVPRRPATGPNVRRGRPDATMPTPTP
jgi:polygalacturonase